MDNSINCNFNARFALERTEENSNFFHKSFRVKSNKFQKKDSAKDLTDSTEYSEKSEYFTECPSSNKRRRNKIKKQLHRPQFNQFSPQNSKDNEKCVKVSGNISSQEAYCSPNKTNEAEFSNDAEQGWISIKDIFVACSDKCRNNNDTQKSQIQKHRISYSTITKITTVENVDSSFTSKGTCMDKCKSSKGDTLFKERCYVNKESKFLHERWNEMLKNAMPLNNIVEQNNADSVYYLHLD
ncbi:hypothetical protein HK099_006905 [Clydaea vesicula]|uniref:Uncharacterized protein n=1 Tax=Clydaea vesicula TaxID=447962 RepID=A0AAD5TXK5_9FUNG|nr:hypothetical protein HK099_006905 [Clydaea vesicula]